MSPAAPLGMKAVEPRFLTVSAFPRDTSNEQPLLFSPICFRTALNVAVQLGQESLLTAVITQSKVFLFSLGEFCQRPELLIEAFPKEL